MSGRIEALNKRLKEMEEIKEIKSFLEKKERIELEIKDLKEQEQLNNNILKIFEIQSKLEEIYEKFGDELCVFSQGDYNSLSNENSTHEYDFENFNELNNILIKYEGIESISCLVNQKLPKNENGSCSLSEFISSEFSKIYKLIDDERYYYAIVIYWDTIMIKQYCNKIDKELESINIEIVEKNGKCKVHETNGTIQKAVAFLIAKKSIPSELLSEIEINIK